MSKKLESTIAVIGIDIGKNSFHIVGHDERGDMQQSSQGMWRSLIQDSPFQKFRSAAVVVAVVLAALIAIDFFGKNLGKAK